VTEVLEGKRTTGRLRGAALAVLVDPRVAIIQLIVDDLQAAALKIGRQIEPFAAGSPRELDLSFVKLSEKNLGARSSLTPFRGT
jgi:hypothetical protein